VSTSTRLLLRSEGFSLVEALVAASLLSVISLGFALGADRAVRHNLYGRALAEATTLAHDKIEELQSKVTADPQLAAGTHTDANNPLRADGTTGGPYTRSWTVTANTPTTGLKTVDIAVTWSLYGQPHTARLVMVHQ